MASKIELVAQTLEQGFPLGEDVPTVLADAERIERLKAAMAEIVDEDLAVEMVGDEEFRRTWHGVEGFVEGWRDWVAPFERFRVELDELTESGPHVLFLVRLIGRPRGVDTEIENEGAAVWTFEGEKLARVEFHLRRDAALRSAALEP
jgi:ketosteroid isomerase-like protein